MTITETLILQVEHLGAASAIAAMAAVALATNSASAAATRLTSTATGAASALARGAATAAANTSAMFANAAAATRAAAAQTLYSATARRGLNASTAMTGALMLGTRLFGIQGLAIAGLALGLGGATVKYQNYEAALKTATGTAANASVAFGALQRFAKETPYTLDQSVNAFLRMTNLGLVPSERALRSYGNTASSFPHKSLMDYVEAVADATSLQFRRLREFGIVAERNGNQVALTFRGVKTEVAATASAIEGYLISIGENQFAGAMSERMQTLGGVISNVGDEWSKLWINMARLGADDTITRGATAVLRTLEEINVQLQSGQLSQNVTATGQAFNWLFSLVKQGLSSTTDFFFTSTASWQAASASASQGTIETWQIMPLAFASLVQTIVAEAAGMVATVSAYASAVGEAFVAAFDLASRRWALFKQQADYLVSAAAAPFYAGGKDSEVSAKEQALKKAEADFAKLQDDATNNITRRLDDKLTAIDQATENEVKAIERQGAERVLALEESLQKADDLRAAWEKKQKELEGKDILGSFYKGPTRGDAPEGASSQAGGGGRSGGAATQAGNAKLEALLRDLMSEEDLIREKYRDREEIILSSTEITEELRSSLMIRAAQEREEALLALEKKTQSERLEAAGQFFGNLASIGSTFGQRGFKLAKAAAIAQATVSMYSAAVKSYDSLASIPYVGPFLGAAAAAAAIASGAANIANIKSQQYSGAYAEGGFIGAGHTGLVGEAGAEFVTGPAIVKSAADSRRALEGRNSANTPITVQIFNPPGMTSSVEEREGPNGEKQIRILTKRIEDKLAHDAARGGGTLVPALALAFGLTRGKS